MIDPIIVKLLTSILTATISGLVTIRAAQIQKKSNVPKSEDNIIYLPHGVKISRRPKSQKIWIIILFTLIGGFIGYFLGWGINNATAPFSRIDENTPTVTQNIPTYTITPTKVKASISPTLTITSTFTPTEEDDESLHRKFNMIYHVAVQGDTFRSISKEFTGSEGSYLAIMHANDVSTLPAGARIKIPLYTILPGDVLSSISEAFEVSLANLLEGNNLTKSSTIYAGNKLIIPINCDVKDCSEFIITD
jgi:LysM repeat protein